MNDADPKSRTPAIPRSAASLILLRTDSVGPRVLMGVRGAGARFMPERRVFPGGAVDAGDRAMAPLAGNLRPRCLARLHARTGEPDLAPALPLTAIRETFEETGLALGTPQALARLPDGAGESWTRFGAPGLAPAVSALRFVFRAITPRSYPIRFDARFFLADASAVVGDPDDLSGASGELSDLSWLRLGEVMGYRDLPAITRFVLAEVQELERVAWVDRPVPFFSDGHGSRQETLP